tara:strand:- start:574 stop:1080 length:507 start_codon:yes stop_codon:yes gene_type:complete
MSRHSKALRAKVRAGKQAEYERRLVSSLKALAAFNRETNGMNTKRKVKNLRPLRDNARGNRLHDARTQKNLTNNVHGRVGKDYTEADTTYAPALVTLNFIREETGERHSITVRPTITAPFIRSIKRQEFDDDCIVRDMNKSLDNPAMLERHTRAFRDGSTTYVEFPGE